MTTLDICIRYVVDKHLCNQPLDVRFAWRRALAEEVKRRNTVVGPDSHKIGEDPFMCLMVKRLNEHLHAEIRREAKRDVRPIQIMTAECV